MQDDPIRIVDEQILSSDYFPLKRITHAQRRADGSVRRDYFVGEIEVVKTVVLLQYLQLRIMGLAG